MRALPAAAPSMVSLPVAGSVATRATLSSEETASRLVQATVFTPGYRETSTLPPTATGAGGSGRSETKSRRNASK